MILERDQFPHRNVFLSFECITSKSHYMNELSSYSELNILREANTNLEKVKTHAQNPYLNLLIDQAQTFNLKIM